MFACLSRRSLPKNKRIHQQRYSEDSKKHQQHSQEPKSFKISNKRFRHSQGASETKNLLFNIEQVRPKLSLRKYHKRRVSKQNSDQLLSVKSRIDFSLPQSKLFSETQKNKGKVIKIDEINLQFDIDETIAEELRQKINNALMTVTDSSNFTKKRYQSSVKGMNKIITNTLIQENSYQQAQIDFYSDTLNEKMIENLINKNWTLCEKFLKKMTYQQKNSKDGKGFTIVHLATLLAIKQNQSDKGSLNMLKKLIKDPQIDIFALTNKKIKVMHEAILYKNIPVVTNLFRESYNRRKRQIKDSINKVSDYLEEIPDFCFQLFVKVSSFIPLVQKIAPDDTIKVYKKGRNLRIDYTLIGYSFLQAKRRNMSCIIQKQDNSHELTIISVNHDQKTYTDLLESLCKEQILLIIQDILCIQHKRISPKIVQSKISRQINIFDHPIRERIGGFLSVKNKLQVAYERKTQKIIPGTKKSSQLQFLSNYESYCQSDEMREENETKNNGGYKKLKLGLWMSKQFPLKYHTVLKIMGLFSLSHQVGRVIYQFLNEGEIKQAMQYFPIKVQIPINFSLYLDIQLTKFDFNVDGDLFSVHSSYTRRKRSEFQKTLTRREKRLAMVKIFT